MEDIPKAQKMYIHKIHYFQYNENLFGIIPSIDKIFSLKSTRGIPTEIISNKKPLFNETNTSAQRIKRVFVLTNACNLQCSYCFEGIHTKWEMFDCNSIESNIRTMFQDAEKSGKKMVSISLFGGEPTMNWSAVQTAVNISTLLEKETNIKCVRAIVTNGLMTIEHARYLAENFDYIYFSFDGPKSLFLNQRKPKNGQNAYEIIYRNAKEVYRHSTHLSFKITVTRLTVDSLKYIDDFFADSFPMCSRMYQPCMVSPDDELYISFGYFLKKYLELKRYSVFAKNISTSLHKNKPSDRFCNLAIRNVLYPNGDILACHRSNMNNPEDIVKKNFKIGFYDNSGLIHRDIYKTEYMQTFNVNEITECKECVFKYHCCGGCPTVKLLSGNGDMFRKADYCSDFVKFLYTETLSRLYEIQYDFFETLPATYMTNELRLCEEDFLDNVVQKIISIEE